MDDYNKALAAARAADKLRFKTGMTAPEAIRVGLDKEKALRNLLAAIDAQEPVAQCNVKQIAWELERTALGDGFYEHALHVAKGLPGVTPEDRALLDRFAKGMNGSTDHVGLVDLANRIYSAPSAQPAGCSITHRSELEDKRKEVGRE